VTFSFGVLLHLVLQLLTALRALTKRDRAPAARAAWLLLIASVPVAGVVLYYLFGETNIGDRTRRRMREVSDRLAARPPAAPAGAPADLPVALRPVFRRAASVNGFVPVAGNAATLPSDEAAAIDALVADIDAARDHVHLLFYIWLQDGNGLRVLDAIQRAAARGVACRVLIDGLGSRALARSARWTALGACGVQTAITFKMRWLLAHVFFARVDLRNHRKIAVIDGRTGYCGSQNCADPAFLPKQRFGPWVDVMIRVEGPVVRQLQHLFIIDWMTHAGEDVAALLDLPAPPLPGGFPAIAVGSGPTIDNRAVSDIFAMLLAAAQEEAIITTPYFVPDDTLHRAICSAARRGVKVTMILPAKNDSFFVARASRSYYSDLLRAGVRLAEYQGGLLHAKTLTVDGVATCLGSANMDRRSFELNFENMMILVSAEVTGAMRARQLAWLSRATVLDPAHGQSWPLLVRAVNNLFATMGPLL
jgi:cardiolipin synthase